MADSLVVTGLRRPRGAARGIPSRIQEASRRAAGPATIGRSSSRRVEPMLSSRTGTTRRSQGRRASVWAGAAVLGLLTATGCQVEYAGMTLPSGKYMHDDVQYFAPGPDFPYANTQAATQRARMQASGMPIPPPPGAVVPPVGAPLTG